ncbi:branched-chain amino acid ABC transporter permease [Aliidongia dinghuensis]|uniref:Branched-chain amino acid ABC transporter permease n=1 Tax=Aliidongia dinghuensis TaxID=1867774 RepID=A0A8J2YZN7_9PROT|nr:urea ABC transporter permease subunit UrtB [Aliidongia dinghuensis]GGF41190.1 branched-chain amino acid ABC transporter permease [Aliidongia dinghuensis]
MKVFRALILAVLLLVLPLAVRAAGLPDADLAKLVAGLAGDGFDDKIAAIDGLGASGDPRAVAILKALGDGKLAQTENNQVLIESSTGQFADAVTGAAVTPAADPDRIRVNNRLRGHIEGALSRLTLFSPDPQDRLKAATEALHRPSLDGVPALDQALAAERDNTVAAALKLARAAALVRSPDADKSLAAIKELTASSDPQVRALLGEVAGDRGADPKAVAAAKSALAGIDRRLALVELGVNLFQGLSLGSVLLLAAIGLAVTFGVMGVINMAHGEMIMLGAYTTFVVQEAFRAFLPASLFDFYLVVSVPAAFLVAGAVGVALERGIIRFLYGRPLETLLATWGISLILQQLVRSIFGAPNKEVANPSWMTGGFEILGGFTITWNRLVIIGFGFAVLGALVLVLRRTNLGLHMRAVTQNRKMAAVMGIPTDRVDALTFGLGSGIAGMAGVALSQIGNVSPNLGTIYIIDSFMVVVFGGVGSLVGTLAGAMGLGVVNKFLEPFAGAVLGKIFVLVAIIIFIQFRPRGLFALKGRSAEA